MRILALLALNAAGLALRRHREADVAFCFPFRGQYTTGCDFVDSMCELHSYTDDPSNPSWCTHYAHGVLTAWTDCERKVRLNATEAWRKPPPRESWNEDIGFGPGASDYPQAEEKSADFGPNFVKCFHDADPDPPDCAGMCALHKGGSCQVLCAATAECHSLCRSQEADGGPIHDRHDILDCMNRCYGTKPLPPPLDENSPRTVNASYPPETAGQQEAIRREQMKLRALEDIYELERGNLERARAQRDAIKAELHHLLKQGLGLAPIPTVAPPPTAAPTNVSNATAAPSLAPVTAAPTEPPPTVSPEEAIATSPILESADAVVDQIGTVQEHTTAIESDTAKMQDEVEQLKLKILGA